MSDDFDFERYWLGKLAGCLEEQGGEELRRAVLAGSEHLTMESDRQEVVDWSRQAMIRLEARVDSNTAQAILTGCACRYPVGQLQAARQAYEASGDVGRAHAVLQAQFEAFLREDLNLTDAQVDQVVERGWGLAGVRRGETTIIATKIPKSGHLAAYLAEIDPEKRRQLYCHCPRVRAAPGLGETLPGLYCYCGAGFYRDIWQEILQRPVRVEVLESVLQGGEVCTVAVYLSTTPSEADSPSTASAPARQRQDEADRTKGTGR